MKGPESAPRSAAALTRELAPLADIALTVSVEIGSTQVPVSDLLKMAHGSVFRLNKPSGAPADIRINGRLVAWGEISPSAQSSCIRVTDIVKPGTAELGVRA